MTHNVEPRLEEVARAIKSKWTFPAEDVARAAYDALKRMGMIRTEGTVKRCQHYATASCGENEDHPNMGVCGRKNCPIRKGAA